MKKFSFKLVDKTLRSILYLHTNAYCTGILLVLFISAQISFDKTRIPLNSYRAAEINLLSIQSETKINTVMRVARQYLSLTTADRQCACLHSENSRWVLCVRYHRRAWGAAYSGILVLMNTLTKVWVRWERGVRLSGPAHYLNGRASAGAYAAEWMRWTTHLDDRVEAGDGWLPSEAPLLGELWSLSPLLPQVCSGAPSLNSCPDMIRSISSSVI